RRSANSPRQQPSCIVSSAEPMRVTNSSFPGRPGSAFRAGVPGQGMSEGSSIAEKPTEKEESQNWQTRDPAGNTAPHCEHILVTVSFCAADASAPVRREPTQNTTRLEMSSRKLMRIVAKEVSESGKGPRRPRASGVHLLGQHIAAKGDAPLQGNSRKVRTMPSLQFRPGLHGGNQSRDRGTATRREGASLASSLTRKKQYAHAAGKTHPKRGVTKRRTPALK